MSQTVKFFAYLAEQIAPAVEVELPEKIDRTIILMALMADYPAFKAEIGGCNVAINQTYVTDETFFLSEVREIALIPPVSGG